ncbi:MAG: DNA internalization-related competence protein ComEC/Rec2 [Lachnospiraceae bacterium]|nr:DNA internalization-related competence protein ComEC/Rec2 [Lachnospiraceae bacterium]
MRRPVCVFGLAFVLILLIYMYLFPLPELSFDEIDGSEAVIIGQVDKKEYRISYGKEILVIYLKKVQVINPQTLDVKNKKLQLSDVWPESDLSQIKGVLCYMKDSQAQEPKLGSYIRISGKFKEFAKAANPGEFDARNYYGILGMQIRLQNGVVLEESSKYDGFREKLWKLRQYLSALIDVCFKEDAHIIKAMLLGEKTGLDEDTKLLYQLNGVIHILSISGLHISIIGMGLYKLLQKLRCPIIINVIISICFMHSYGIMTGMSISAIRAIVMFAFHIAAGIFGRTYDMLTAMAIVGISILFRQPFYLYHSGFLFSFGAILAIGLFFPTVEEKLLGESKIEKVMSTSLSISIVTLPVYLCFYYEYPLYSVLLNLIIIPGTTLIVYDGLISIAAAIIYLPLGKYTAFPARLIFRFYEFCCNSTLKFPGSRSILGKPESWQIFIFIVIIVVLVLGSSKWTKLQFWQWLLAALLCITMRFHSGLVITVLDVGQGDGIYITDENNNRYFIDGGSSSKSDVGTYQILPFLKAEGADRMTAIFVTHMDSDHYNGIAALIEDMAQGGIVIENLIMPDIGEKSRSDAYYELVGQAKAEGINVLYIHKGESIQNGKLKLTCLHPDAGEDREDTNAASTVLYLEYEAFSALFTGDLEGDGEKSVTEYLAENEKIIAPDADTLTKNDMTVTNKDITLLKVAHHGSRNSTAQSFLDIVSPRIAIISAGRDNSYGHPHAETLERLNNAGCRIYRTDEGGAITVKVSNGKVRVEEFLEHFY